MANAMLAVPVAPFESRAVRVIACVPTARFATEKEPPDPIDPDRSLVHVKALPVSGPSSGSIADPAKDTVSPTRYTEPTLGDVIEGRGLRLAGGSGGGGVGAVASEHAPNSAIVITTVLG
jgi:hypothetical protein